MNGKINAWRIESLRVLHKAKQGGVITSATEKQTEFANEKVGLVQQAIADFDFCDISLLNIRSLYKVLPNADTDDQMGEFVYYMSSCHMFELIIVPGATTDMFELVTRFNQDYFKEFVFGNESKRMRTRFANKRKR